MPDRLSAFLYLLRTVHMRESMLYNMHWKIIAVQYGGLGFRVYSIRKSHAGF